jgi:hypothetical protein
MSGIEVTAIFCTLLSQYMLTNKDWRGFLVSIMGNISWIIGVGAPSIIVINAVFIIINLRGIYKYTRGSS